MKNFSRLAFKNRSVPITASLLQDQLECLSALYSVDAEIPVNGRDLINIEGFAYIHKAGVSKIHWQILVFLNKGVRIRLKSEFSIGAMVTAPFCTQSRKSSWA